MHLNPNFRLLLSMQRCDAFTEPYKLDLYAPALANVRGIFHSSSLFRIKNRFEVN